MGITSTRYGCAMHQVFGDTKCPGIDVAPLPQERAVLDFIRKHLREPDLLEQLEEATRSELHAAAVGLLSHGDVEKMRVLEAITTSVANLEYFFRLLPRVSWAALSELLRDSTIQRRDGELYLWIDEGQELKLEDGHCYGPWDW